MNILLLGSGGREHAFAWKLAQSLQLKNLYISPGNGGTSQHGTNVQLDILDFSAIEQFVQENDVQMIVVGPEAPLVAGVYDYFEDEDVSVIGPSKQGAMLEGSKAFSKRFMQRHNIPTANYFEVTSENLQAGFSHIDNSIPPIVLKADGLAGGKGVLIITNKEEARSALRNMVENKQFGKSSEKVVIEEFLDGIEFSVFVLTDGKNYKILPIAKDYKRIGEGGTGLNTGGMGAVSPVPFVNDALIQQVEEKVIIPTVEGLQKENITYKGFIYVGLIKVGNEAKVIEYNCRMGDPETQVVLPRLENDLLDLFKAVAEEKLAEKTIKIKDETAVTVVVASGGYPEKYSKGREMKIPITNDDTIVFHAGTTQPKGKLLTNGGRVLTVTSFGKNIQEAVSKSNAIIEQIEFENKYYRKDIGWEFK